MTFDEAMKEAEENDSSTVNDDTCCQVGEKRAVVVWPTKWHLCLKCNNFQDRCTCSEPKVTHAFSLPFPETMGPKFLPQPECRNGKRVHGQPSKVGKDAHLGAVGE